MRATLEADVEVGKGVGVAIIVNSDNLQQSGFSYINLISKTDISLFVSSRLVHRQRRNWQGMISVATVRCYIKCDNFSEVLQLHSLLQFALASLLRNYDVQFISYYIQMM